MPQFPTFAPPRTLAEADYQKRMMDAVAELEKKRIEADRARAEQPGRVQEAGQTAGAIAGAQADVRRAGQPGRVEEAGETTAAQTRAKLETEEAIKRRQDAERLDTAIREVEKLIQPGGLLQRATGSGAGALIDAAGNLVGMSSRAAEAAAAIPPIADLVLKMVPRFEGPQGVRDVQIYEKAAGDLSNPTTPNPQRLAAAREILRLMRDRRDQFSYTAGGSTTPTAGSAPQRPAATAAPPAPPAPPGMSQSDWGRLWGVMKPEERALWQN